MPRHRPDRARRVLSVALGGAFLAHAVALAVEDRLHEQRVRIGGFPVALAPAAIATAAPPADPIDTDLLDGIALVALPPDAVMGPGDAAAFTGAHPMPRASADLPGRAAASRGGGAAGGATTWTGRDDRDPTPLRAQRWNGADEYRAPRRDLDRRAATPESIARDDEEAWGDRQARSVARAGEPRASVGDRTGAGAGQGELVTTADPDEATLEAAAGATAPARVDGATRPTREDPLVDRGARATDVSTPGRAGDDVAVAAASSERDPDPYDLTSARAGGADGEGVRGRRAAEGALVDGRGAETGATRAAVAKGKGGMSVFASRTDPYLRELLRRLDREIRFPRDLKLDLRSGRVIAVLTVRPDGTITDVAVATSSGFDGFDSELTRALRVLGSLGPVPDKLLDGRRALKVMVPYTFRNPMIR